MLKLNFSIKRWRFLFLISWAEFSTKLAKLLHEKQGEQYFNSLFSSSSSNFGSKRPKTPKMQ